MYKRQEYTNKKVKKATKTERPSVLAKLNQFKEMVKNAVVDRTKRKAVSYTHLDVYKRQAGGMAEKASERPGTMKGAAYEGYFSP